MCVNACGKLPSASPDGLATKAGIKTIVMTHFGPSVHPNDGYQRFADEAKKYFSGKVVLAKDLMEF
jgi:ribonuclease BN (tRNA processing enzyme)